MIHSLYDVFTPTRPARLTFVERQAINDKLVAALRTPGKQIVVYGHSGSGKTTLLTNKLHQLYEEHITSRCVADTTLDVLVLDAFDQLGSFYEVESRKEKGGTVSAQLAAEYAGIKSAISTARKESTTETSRRILPPQLTPQRLGEFLGASRKCWVLEDFHKVVDEDKARLAQVMKVFMDLADSHPMLKVVAIGAVDTARQVVEADAEMKNRLAEIHVPLMSADELSELIAKGKECLNFELPKSVEDEIVRYSNGLASVCHQICLNICDAAGITRTSADSVAVTDENLDLALKRYIEDASDTLKSAFDKALKRVRSRRYDNCRLIVRALAGLHQDGATHAEVLAEVRKTTPEYPSGNLTTYLRELQGEERGAVLRYDAASGRFSFSDPVYRAFADSLLGERRRELSVSMNSVDVWSFYSNLRDAFDHFPRFTFDLPIPEDEASSESDG